MKQTPKIAIVADWLTNLGGAERVVWQMHKAFPDAPIYTSVYNQAKLPQFKKADIRTSWLQNLPLLNKRHQLLMPFLPRVFESFDFSDYDVVISSSFAFAKGIITNLDTVHVCYCHNPTRYFWDESKAFWAKYPAMGITRWFGKFLTHGLRKWDWLAAQRPDYYLANSEFVKRRIAKYYRRDAEVLYPGIELPDFLGGIAKTKGDYYLAVGRITAQKYFDLLVLAFNELQLPLKIAGTGPGLAELKRINTSPNTQFLGFVEELHLQDLYASAKGLVFPQAEDFGIVPLEAQAQGCPVIAYAYGGALETVEAGRDAGMLFEEQSVECLVDAVKSFEKRFSDVDHGGLRKHAEKFSAERFREGLRRLVKEGG